MKSTSILVASFFLVFTMFSCKSNSQTQEEAAPVEQISNVARISDISVAEAKKLIETNKNLIIIDVRTPGEIAEGKIEGSLEMDINNSNFSGKLAELDKDKEYLVYCKAGGRSAKAMGMMESLGFKSVKNMEGGYTAWSDQ